MGAGHPAPMTRVASSVRGSGQVLFLSGRRRAPRASVRNVGPPLAALGIAFGDEQAVLGALAAVLVSGLAAALPIAAVLGRDRDGGTG